MVSRILYYETVRRSAHAKIKLYKLGDLLIGCYGDIALALYLLVCYQFYNGSANSIHMDQRKSTDARLNACVNVQCCCNVSVVLVMVRLSVLLIMVALTMEDLMSRLS